MFLWNETELDLEGRTLPVERQTLLLKQAMIRCLPNYLQTGVYEAQSYGNFGESVMIGIVDSGIDYNHEQFRPVRSHLKRGVRVSEMGYPHQPFDRHGHGTQVAGIIAGKDIGIAPLAELCVVKCAPQRGEYLNQVSRLTAGIRYCVQQGCDLINLSLGTPAHENYLRDACREAFEKNVVLVAAAGNHFTGANFPASYTDYVISVGAVDVEKRYTGSNVWPGMVVVAPGRDIFSSDKKNKYCLVDGSSVAAPHVTGIIALAIAACRKSKKPITPQHIKRCLRETADKSVMDLERVEEFMENYDPQRKIFQNREEVASFMFGAGFIQAEPLVRQLIR